MNIYPLKDINRDLWQKKVSSTSMYTVPAEDEAYPVLQQIEQLLNRLLAKPLHETLDESVVPYFFTGVFPIVCQKIIRSRYFKNQEVLRISNEIIKKSVQLVAKFPEVGKKNPRFLDILVHVFSDESYFKSNSQLPYYVYPYSYYPVSIKSEQLELSVGDLVDIIKIGSFYEKFTWSRGRVIEKTYDNKFQIQYLYDRSKKTTIVSKSSHQVAPLKSRSHVFQWRLALKEGDLVDVQDSYGSWYNGTVVKIAEKQEGQKIIKVETRVYDESGDKVDPNSNKRYFGFSDRQQILDFTSPKLAPFCTVAKKFCYQSKSSFKSSVESVDDLNDYEFQEINGLKIYALPRKRYLSEVLFTAINQFGQMGGFEVYLQHLEGEINFDILATMIRSLSGVSSYLNRKIVREFYQRLKSIVQKYLFGNHDKSINFFTKQVSEVVYSGLKALGNRLFSSDIVSKYQNGLKMKYVETCLLSDALKNKLQGLRELKDIVKSIIYVSEKNRYIKNWIYNNKIFEKVYLVNSHVQLIKTSESFFKYYIQEDLLEVEDLQKLYRIAQKGDFESRLSIYKLFSEVASSFKQNHVMYLVDQILESEISLILNQDIELLFQLVKYFSYFPLKKVLLFFDQIIFEEGKSKELSDFVTQKYSEMTLKTVQLKTERKNLFRNYLDKLETHDITKVAKVLKTIFEGFSGLSEWHKKDISQIIVSQNVDERIIKVIRNRKSDPQFCKSSGVFLDLLLCLYKANSKIPIYDTVLIQIWGIYADIDKKQLFKWVNQVSKCEQGITSENMEELQTFCLSIFPFQSLPSLQSFEFELAKTLFIQMNEKVRYIIVTTLYSGTKEFKRNVSMSQLKLFPLLLQMVYRIESNSLHSEVLNFFISLYTSRKNSQKQVDDFLDILLNNFLSNYHSKDYHSLGQTLKLIQVVINDSEKKIQTKLKPLIEKKIPDYVKFILINQYSYSTSESTNKIQIVLPMNMTLMQLRKRIGKQLKASIEEVKIIYNKQIQQYYNSKTLKELKFSPNQPITFSRKMSSSKSQQQELILDNKFSPKALRCFKLIFQKFSTDGKMSKDQCHNFTAACLGSTSGPRHHKEKIQFLYDNYDDDKDGILTEANFIKFYEDAAKDRPSIVWSNLKSLGVNSNLRFNNEPYQEVDIIECPRKRIAQYPNFYEILFELLKVKEVALSAYQLLDRLPVSSSIQSFLLSINDRKDIEKLVETKDLYELCYKLSIFEYLALCKDLEKEEEKNWHKKFVEFEGYEILYRLWKRISSQESENGQDGQILIQINEIVFNLLNNYWQFCFSKGNEKVSASLGLLNFDGAIQDKIQYCVLKKEKNFKPIHPVNFQHVTFCQWKEDGKNTISDNIVQYFIKQWSSVGKLNISSNLNLLIYKLIDSLNILLINQNPQNLIESFQTIFQQSSNSELTQRFYSLILTICYFSETKHQTSFIREMFRNLTKDKITSDHFQVLASLVSEYGNSSYKQSNDKDQITEKQKQILLQNILKNSNEFTIEGCAKLIINFNLSDIEYDVFETIWLDRLFSSSSICEKQQTKVALFDFILKVCQQNQELKNKVVQRVISTMDESIKKMRITYSSQFKERSLIGYVGLKNLANTCYINSMLQQVFMNKNFRYLLLRANDNEKPNMISITNNKNETRMVDDNFLHQVQRIFSYLELSTRIDFTPADFCIAYKPFGASVDVFIQQDVQEFISMFFERLEGGLSKTIFKKLVEEYYAGKSANLIKCHSCLKVKKIEDPFYSISLEVKSSKSLAQSFNRFCHGEIISDYKCDFCQNKVDVTKKTRISKAPKILMIHLQRIVFNLETFINEKITTKHTFPLEFNLHQSTLDCYEKAEAGETEIKQPEQLNYNLIGVICHKGTADSGHYISYIKTGDKKWIQCNDSLVTSFNPSNIQTQCFGGSSITHSFDDDYYGEKKQQSKSAYILLYEKQGDNNIQIVLSDYLKNIKNEEEKSTLKQTVLKELYLKQVISVKEQKKDNLQIVEVETKEIQKKGQNESNSNNDDEDETKRLLEQKQIQIKRHLSQDSISQQPLKEVTKEDKIVSEPQKIYVSTPISPYISQSLKAEVLEDNQTHFLEKTISSLSFARFFSRLMSKHQVVDKQLLDVCQKYTFGFWLKSSAFKQLLEMLSSLISNFPDGFESFITNNSLIINLLIQSSDSDVRSSMANFLSKTIGEAIREKGITIQKDSKHPIFLFLDNLFSLLPTTVSKCWTKFSQYFEFWYEFSKKGEAALDYMISRQVLKHFMDYFLDTKSPLKIYATKRQHQIGSSYAQPNFHMLLKTVFSILELRKNNQKKDSEQKKLLSGPQQQILLVSFQALEKLISDNFDSIAAQIVKQVCLKNLSASQKAAIVLLKGISKSTTDSIQPYLTVLHQFILLEDQYQNLRIKWVLGKQTLSVSCISYKITSMNSYSTDERLHNFESSISLDGGSSLLESIYNYHKRMETFSMFQLRQLLKLCKLSKAVRNYVFKLDSPTLEMSKYTDFFKKFIDKYDSDQKRGYYGYNRPQLLKEVQQIYKQVLDLVLQQGIQKQFYSQKHLLENKILSQKSTPTKEQKKTQNIFDNIKKYEVKKMQTFEDELYNDGQKWMDHQQDKPKIGEVVEFNSSDQQIKELTLKSSSQSQEKPANTGYQEVWQPVKIQFELLKKIPTSPSFDRLFIEEHDFVISYVQTKPTGFSNKALSTGSGFSKNIQKITKQCWETEKKIKVRGFFVQNKGQKNYRIQTTEGCSQSKYGDSLFVWDNQIVRVWESEKTMDWPKWRLYEQNITK